MNERIKELAELAGMYIVDDEFSTYGKFAEKFADLIVKEYNQVFTNQMREYRFDERVHLGLGDVRLTIGMQEDILEKVKQHFGVECNCVGVNTAPQKQWLSLTDQEVWEAIEDVLEGGGWLDVARTLEQAFKEKNT